MSLTLREAAALLPGAEAAVTPLLQAEIALAKGQQEANGLGEAAVRRFTLALVAGLIERLDDIGGRAVETVKGRSHRRAGGPAPALGSQVLPERHMRVSADVLPLEKPAVRSAPTRGWRSSGGQHAQTKACLGYRHQPEPWGVQQPAHGQRRRNPGITRPL